MDACNQDFLNKGCVCLADPLDPWTTICAYVDKISGLVYPCNLGCCVPRCQNVGQSQNLNMELHATGGTTLPPGFGQELTSTTSTIGPGGSASGGGTTMDPIDQNTSKIRQTRSSDYPGPTDPPDKKVWQVLASLFIFLLIVVIAAGFLD